MSLCIYQWNAWIHQMHICIYKINTWIHQISTWIHQISTWIHQVSTWIHQVSTWIHQVRRRMSTCMCTSEYYIHASDHHEWIRISMCTHGRPHAHIYTRLDYMNTSEKYMMQSDKTMHASDDHMHAYTRRGYSRVSRMHSNPKQTKTCSLIHILVIIGLSFGFFTLYFKSQFV